MFLRELSPLLYRLRRRLCDSVRLGARRPAAAAAVARYELSGLDVEGGSLDRLPAMEAAAAQGLALVLFAGLGSLELEDVCHDVEGMVNGPGRRDHSSPAAGPTQLRRPAWRFRLGANDGRAATMPPSDDGTNVGVFAYGATTGGGRGGLAARRLGRQLLSGVPPA